MYILKRGFLNFGLSLALAGSLAYGSTVLAATEDEHKHGCFFSLDGDGAYAFYFIGGKHLGVLIEDGLKVSKVLKGSAAEKAGIKAGDVITAIGGQPVSTLSEVRKKLREVEFGKPFDVSVQRDGASVQLSATLEKRELRWSDGEHPLERARAARKKPLDTYAMFNPSRGRLGVSTQELTEQLRDYFGVEKATGVLVASVGENTPAARAGIKAGDVITAINGARISDTGDIQNELRKIESGDCTLTVVRKGKTMQLKATLEPRESFELPIEIPEIVLPKIEAPIRLGLKAII